MSTASPVPRLAGQLALAGLALSGATALLVWALEAGHQARHLLGLGFDRPSRQPGGALEIAATNLRLVGACLVAAAAVRERPQLRPPLDATLGLLLALNTAAVGAALGAYGARLIEAVALHGLLELAAFAGAGGAYLAARGGELSSGGLAVTAVVAVALLTAGAVAETYVHIGAGR